LAVLALALAIFFFWAGPVWRHPWQIDASVYWSYAAIPALVAGVLLVARKWGWRAFLLGTLEVTLLKFGITYGLATVMWATSGEPPAPPAPSMPGVAAKRVEKHAPTDVGEISGRAAPGALVWIDGGLEAYAFPAPKGAAEMFNDGQGFQPALVMLQVGQPLQARVTDGHTHTLHAKDDRTGALRNLAIPAGVPRTVDFARPMGLVEVNCLVHPSEKPSWLLVVDHPFFGRADDKGRFSWQGVPAGKVRVAAFDPGRGRLTTEVTVAKGARTDLTLEFGSPIQ
jgi:hypothetical protein